MNGLRTAVQPCTACLVFGLAVAFAGPTAHADEAGAPEIVAARELFRLGTEDADAGRFALALEKFRRVAAVKETANVRFNIARCEESLNKTGAALADYETAEREAAGDANAARGDSIARLAHDHADALRARVPRLGVIAPSPAPAGLVVTLDGSKLSLTTLGVPLPVDPGTHVIDATATGRDPFHTQVVLVESQAKTVSIAMAAGDPGAPPVDQPLTLPTTPSSSQRTWGIVALATGGAFAAGSVAFLLLHNGAVSSIEGDCPGGLCPASRQSDVTSLQSTAKTDQTVSIVFAASAVVATGVGAYLVLSAPTQTAPSAMIAPGAAGAPMGLSVLGRF